MRLLEKNKKKQDLLLKQNWLLKRLKEKDLLKSIVKKWKGELKLKDLSKKDSVLNMSKGKSKSELKEKGDLKNTESSKKRERPKGKPESKLRDLSTKKELNSKDSSEKRSLKNTDLSRRELKLKEKLSLRP